MILNEYIYEARSRSFFMDGNLVCEFLVFFLKLSTSGWTSLTINEGVSLFKKLQLEPKLLPLSEIQDDFAYPVSQSNYFDEFLQKRILSLHEYRIDGVDEGCIGVYFNFGDCGLTILEIDGCLEISHGFKKITNEEVSLHKLSI